MQRKKGVAGSDMHHARKWLGLSQQQLGELLDVSRNTFRSWEAGKGPAFLPLLCRGLRAYKALPHLFIDLTGPCLADMRTRIGMNQEQLASRLSVSRPSVSRWENDTPPKWVVFAVTALAFFGLEP